jgi:ribosomal protein L11 methyltransferase
MAFGTGTHPTTQLCLEMFEAYLQTVHIDRTIDVGCGSGILSISAVILGVKEALGVDIDPQAIQVARDNAQINGVANRIELALGSVPDIKKGSYTFNQAPLVFTNILAPTIIQLLEIGLAEIISPGGYLIVSGILHEQAEPVILSMQKSNLRLIDQRSHGDWIALGATLA